MLDKNLLNTIKTYSKNMTRPIQLILGDESLANDLENKRAELVEFLTQIASTTDKIGFDVAVTADDLLSSVSFKVVVNNDGTNVDTGIVFSGIPGGHEFTSLILAILHAGGHTMKLDERIQSMIKNANLSEPLHFQTYIALSCHSCPDVVQALNQFALLNDDISSEMIDGALFSEQVEANNIQGVPAVFLNGKPFANGKVEIAMLLEKLQEQYPDIFAGAGFTEQLPQQDVTIIGGGPAGVAAAIYCARKGFATTIVADRIGGQVKDTQDIENLISIPLTNGNELSANFVKHIAEYDISVKEHVSVKQVNEKLATAEQASDKPLYTIELNTGEQFDSRSIIIATGAKWRKLGVPGEDENIGNGVAYCPHCDGPFFKGKDTSVIGGGNSGIEAALDLAGIVNHVTVFEFADTLKADQVLIDKAMAKDNIEIITSAATKEIKATDGKVSSLIYTDRNTGEDKEVKLSAVFVQIGLVPNSDFIKNFVDTNKFGEIEIDAKCQTSRQGIFAAGDVTTVPFKQINIAMGEGSKAALSAFDYLVMQ